MNVVRPERQFEDLGPAAEGFDGGASLPPTGGGGGGGGPGGAPGRRDLPPRRGYRQHLPWIALGVVVLALERGLLFVLTSRDLSPSSYAFATAGLLAMVLAGVGVGGVAFHRAWKAGHRS